MTSETKTAYEWLALDTLWETALEKQQEMLTAAAHGDMEKQYHATSQMLLCLCAHYATTHYPTKIIYWRDFENMLTSRSIPADAKMIGLDLDSLHFLSLVVDTPTFDKTLDWLYAEIDYGAPANAQ
ncbi:hypothetical protein [Nesterenkonia aerolata]|uniref:Uncharacterized protein n=1 Tax=Nesterenkonia aerolata TaxID=3074079 RepID=A0ABU2DSR6_9MICC|nr:hypothetical protein [Nesterenkonia sp. LY-0111]MDR8019410.1 hypothetical protein [Nesterenkonia sp. LY-0111]